MATSKKNIPNQIHTSRKNRKASSVINVIKYLTARNKENSKTGNAVNARESTMRKLFRSMDIVLSDIVIT
jgi:hypothetical protein